MRFLDKKNLEWYVVFYCHCCGDDTLMFECPVEECESDYPCGENGPEIFKHKCPLCINYCGSFTKVCRDKINDGRGINLKETIVFGCPKCSTIFSSTVEECYQGSHSHLCEYSCPLCNTICRKYHNPEYYRMKVDDFIIKTTDLTNCIDTIELYDIDSHGEHCKESIQKLITKLCEVQELAVEVIKKQSKYAFDKLENEHNNNNKLNTNAI